MKGRVRKDSILGESFLDPYGCAMTDHGLPTLDPDLLALLPQYDQASVEMYATPSPHEVHESGLRLLSQGYLAQAEICFRVARQAAATEGNSHLAALATLELARSLNGRAPAAILNLLASLDASTLSLNARSMLINLLGQALESLCSYRAADRYYMTLLDHHSIDPVLGACVKGNRATLLFDLGAADEARKLNTEARDNLLDLEETHIAGLITMNMAANAMHEADYESSLNLFDQAFSLLGKTNNIKLAAFLKINNSESEIIHGNLTTAYEFIIDGQNQAAITSVPVLQVQSLILRYLLEERSNNIVLLQSIRDSVIDLNARHLYQEAAPISLLAACLADHLGLPTDPYLSTLSSSFASTAQTHRLLSHYKRLFVELSRRTHKARPAPFAKFLTRAHSVITIKERLAKLVDTDVRILLEGESGTGKSFLARTIHEAGSRRNAPFIIVDCTNLEENLFESKLFGHLRGSFTGAISDTVGLVEQANGGTLFLDEIGELPTEIQGKLLYTIEEQRYRPVGAKTERRSEFRIIAATNRNVDSMVSEGSLRNDLFFRLAGFRITLPPLRDRREDLTPLIELRLCQLNSKYGRRKTLRHDATDALMRYGWPGNVRELNATLERGYHLSIGRRISLDDLGIGLSPNSLDVTDLSWYSVQRSHLLRVLQMFNGNVSRAAQVLGLNRTTLIYKLKSLNIDRKHFDPKHGAAVQDFHDPEG